MFSYATLLHVIAPLFSDISKQGPLSFWDKVFKYLVISTWTVSNILYEFYHIF